MKRDVERRLRRLEKAAASPRMPIAACPLPIDWDNPPTWEEIEAAVNEPPMTDEEWEATYCTPDWRSFDGWARLRAKMARGRPC